MDRVSSSQFFEGPHFNATVEDEGVAMAGSPKDERRFVGAEGDVAEDDDFLVFW